MFLWVTAIGYWGTSSFTFFLFFFFFKKKFEDFFGVFLFLFYLGSYWSSHNVFVFCSDIYPILERVCLEGSRIEAKSAVAAIAALGGVSEQFFFSELCKVYLLLLQFFYYHLNFMLWIYYYILQPNIVWHALFLANMIVD